MKSLSGEQVSSGIPLPVLPVLRMCPPGAACLCGRAPGPFTARRLMILLRRLAQRAGPTRRSDVRRGGGPRSQAAGSWPWLAPVRPLLQKLGHGPLDEPGIDVAVFIKALVEFDATEPRHLGPMRGDRLRCARSPGAGASPAAPACSRARRRRPVTESRTRGTLFAIWPLRRWPDRVRGPVRCSRRRPLVPLRPAPRSPSAVGS